MLSNQLMTKLLFINKTPLKCTLVALLFLFVGCENHYYCDADPMACNYEESNHIFDSNVGECTYPTHDSDGSYIGNIIDGNSEFYDCSGNCLTADSDYDGICNEIDENPYDINNDVQVLLDIMSANNIPIALGPYEFGTQGWNDDKLFSLNLNNLNLAIIPNTIGTLEHLNSLVLSNNILNSIPSEIGNLTNLIYLALNHNQINIEVPSTIGNLIKLRDLHLSNNQFTGEIPVGIGDLTDLRNLYLYNNQLSGEIPQVVCDLIESNNLNMSYITDGNNLINTCDD